MIGLIGIKKSTPLEIREKFAIKPKKHREYIQELLKNMEEVVLLATCNRTEIYFNVSNANEEELLKKVFETFGWEYDYREYIFIIYSKDVYKHIFEVCCGFHSKILGEDQILGQVKDVFEEALEVKAVSLELHRLFQDAITCGKRFKKESKLFEIPVSSASIAVNEAVKHRCTKFMVLGYGEVGKLVFKYLLPHEVERVYLVVRNNKIKDEIIHDERVNIISFQEKNEYINEVECIIGCTAAPHAVVKEEDIKKEGNKLIIYDLAVPRDVEKEVALMDRTEVYNIDDISYINDENKRLRKERMQENRKILNKYLEEYENWLSLRKVSNEIQKLKSFGHEVYEKRSKTFVNKSKSNNEKDIILADRLIKSTSDFYINRAIEVLKEETLKGCGEECMEIIEKIFQKKK